LRSSQKKALRLRSLGQMIVEIVGGRGTHPVTAVAGGMSCALGKDGCAPDIAAAFLRVRLRRDG